MAALIGLLQAANKIPGNSNKIKEAEVVFVYSSLIDTHQA